MERAKLPAVILLVVIAFGFLLTSVRTSLIADEGDAGVVALPTAKITPAPDWTVPNSRTGQMVNLRAQSRLRPVVFSFWATWCGPCKQELPHLENISERYKGRVAFFGVNSDDAPASINAFAQRTGLTFPLLADVRHEAATRYGVQSIPLLVVVDTQGSIRAVSNGYDPSEDLESTLPKLLDTLLAEGKNLSQPLSAQRTHRHETSSARCCSCRCNACAHCACRRRTGSQTYF